jgi:hypothetical protein
MLNEKQQKKIEIFIQKQEDKKLKIKMQKRKKEEKRLLKKDEIIKPKKKRKVGRPKKRGPKKKRIRRKIIKTVKPRPVIDYKIITTLNGKQNGYIGFYQTYADAYSKLQELIKANDEIVFPRKYLNSGVINLSKDEYLILEKNRYGDKEDGLLRNEYGKIIKHKIVNNTKWIIREKAIRLIEETFWVYGYDPKADRKTYQWIFNDLLIGNLETQYDIIRILVYKNKLIIKYDSKPISMIMCKNKSDAIRLYNKISEDVRNNKLKQIVCVGACNVICEARKELEKDIIELTGWNKRKIQRSTN